MEIPARQPSFRLTPHLVIGVLIILLGVIFTLDNLDMADAGAYLRFWPTGIVAVGLAKLWQARTGHGSSLGGAIFVLVGGWLQLESLDLVDQSMFDFWPLILVLIGAVVVWHAIRGRQATVAPEGAATGDDTITAIAVLSGINRSSSSRAFRGGELTAIMGGCEIDLRRAAIDGEAIIDVFAMWGGIEIRVPEEWTVIGRVTPLLGGFEDQTRAPRGTGNQKLIVRGMVVMGGVDIKN